jgi:RNA-directed DNA polymerase
MVLEPIFEKEFAPQSYGFRPGRGCKDALRQVDRLLRSGQVHVVDVDLKGYFDSIPHAKLMALVEERVADGRVLELIGKFLQQGVMEQMQEVEPAADQGTPQGGVISPLLANLYLNPLDWLMAEQGVSMIRYADDMVMLCESAEQAVQALDSLQRWCQEAGLEVHPQKTKIVDMGQPGSHFDFLGYRFKRTHRRRLRRFIRPKSLQRIKERIRPLTRRTNGQRLCQVVLHLAPILRGVHGYFHHAYAGQLREIDQWIRGRLRSIQRKRHKGKGRGRGNDHHKWPNHYFEQLGLLSLEAARREQLISLQKGANC